MAEPFLASVSRSVVKSASPMRLMNQIHSGYVFGRRIRVLASHLAPLIPMHAKVLDVGAGDGSLARQILDRRPDVELSGIDVLVRPQTHVPVVAFDGKTIPFPDRSFDVVMFVDVLHHTLDAMALLREAARVARHSILLKDHNLNGIAAGLTLRFMDRVGNARHGVALPYCYWPRKQWFEAFDALGVTVGVWKRDLALFPIPARWLFDRSLHFVARLDLPQRDGATSRRR